LVSTDISTGSGFVNGGNIFGAAANVGTNDANALNLRTNGATRVSMDTSGGVQVSGQAWSTIQTSSAASPLAWDANTGNSMIWTNDVATITANITNMKAGAAYMLIVDSNGAGTGTVSISCNGGAVGNSRFVPANGNRVNGTVHKTVYTLMWDGTDCLITWITGF
jgi:hypothetical protein